MLVDVKRGGQLSAVLRVYICSCAALYRTQHICNSLAHIINLSINRTECGKLLKEKSSLLLYTDTYSR